jgi:hypothetical protein
VGHTLSGPAGVVMQRPAQGTSSGMFLAGGIAAALFARERDGRGRTVDVALLAGGVWTLAPDLVAASVLGADPPKPGQAGTRPPLGIALVGMYTTADGRVLQLNMLATDKYWKAACEALEAPDFAADPALATDAGRAARMPEIRERFARTIATRPLPHWMARLRSAGCIFSSFATPTEVQSDPQVLANGYLPRHPSHPKARLAASPVQFDEAPIRSAAAAGKGEHTDSARGMGSPRAVAAGCGRGRDRLSARRPSPRRLPAGCALIRGRTPFRRRRARPRLARPARRRSSTEASRQPGTLGVVARAPAGSVGRDPGHRARDGSARGVIDGITVIPASGQCGRRLAAGLGLAAPARHEGSGRSCARARAGGAPSSATSDARASAGRPAGGARRRRMVNLHANSRRGAGRCLAHPLLPRRPAQLLFVPRNLARWEALPGPPPIVGSVDAHAKFRLLGPVGGTVDRYRDVFRLLTTHVLARDASAASILEALRSGRSYVALEGLGRVDAFRFEPSGGGFHLEAPEEARLTLLCDGRRAQRR